MSIVLCCPYPSPVLTPCVHILMCCCTYFCSLVAEWQGSSNALSHDTSVIDAPVSAVLCLPACLCVSPQRPVARPPTGTRQGEEALHRRIEGAHAPSHERAGPAGAALLWIHVHLRDPTFVAHLSHVFAP